MTLEELVARLPGAKPQGDSWTARCPAHQDTTPSLSISQGRDGRVVLHCHAGCKVDSIVAKLGLTMSDLFPPRMSINGNATVQRRILELYDYTDEDGCLLYQVVRFYPKDFRQRRPDPARDEEWIWSLGETRLVPYRLAELLEAVAMGRTVYVVEGEKDADALRSLGLCATTNAQGAGKWRDEFAPHFAGARVVVLPDNDEAGRRHATDVERSLAGVAAEVRIINLPNLPAKGDVSDWLGAGGSREQLDAIADAAAQGERTRYTLGELKARPELLAPPEYVIARLVARSRSTLLYSAEKAGKSTLTAAMIAAKSRGDPLFDTSTRPGVVLLIALEDFVGDVVRRLVQFGGDDNRVHIVDHLQGSTIDERLTEIRRHITETHAELVIVDTLIAFVAGRVESTNSDGEMQPVVQGLSDIAHILRCGLLIVAHANKTGASWRGSGAIGGSVDVVAEMTTPEPETDPTLRAFHVRGRIPVEHFRVRYTGSGFDLVDDGLLDIEARVLDKIACNPGCSQTAIRGHVTGKASLIDEAVVRLVERGIVLDRGSGRHHAYFRAEGYDLSRSGTGGTGQTSSIESTSFPRPRPCGTGPGQGEDDLWDGLSGQFGQGPANLREPPKGVPQGASSPATGLAHA